MRILLVGPTTPKLLGTRESLSGSRSSLRAVASRSDNQVSCSVALNDLTGIAGRQEPQQPSIRYPHNYLQETSQPGRDLIPGDSMPPTYTLSRPSYPPAGTGSEPCVRVAYDIDLRPHKCLEIPGRGIRLTFRGDVGGFEDFLKGNAPAQRDCSRSLRPIGSSSIDPSEGDCAAFRDRT